MDEIVVEASPITKEGKADTASPAPGHYKVMMSSRVSYADLDLSWYPRPMFVLGL